jgi:hypothetical protein
MQNLQNVKKKIFMILKYQNKNLQSSQDKKHIPCFLACETLHKKIENPKMIRRGYRFQNFKIPKLKKPSKVTRRNKNTPSPRL